jgi:hypothetical protein
MPGFQFSLLLLSPWYQFLLKSLVRFPGLACIWSSATLPCRLRVCGAVSTLVMDLFKCLTCYSMFAVGDPTGSTDGSTDGSTEDTIGFLVVRRR